MQGDVRTEEQPMIRDGKSMFLSVFAVDLLAVAGGYLLAVSCGLLVVCWRLPVTAVGLLSVAGGLRAVAGGCWRFAGGCWRMLAV